MKTAPTILGVLALLLGAMPALAQQPSDLGRTTFANSGVAEAQEPFLRGILLLHSFEYEDAREAFREAHRRDPGFAMAYWGEAMTHNHPIWMQQDQQAAQAALKALGATSEDRLAKAPTEREKDYLRVADVLFFGEGDKETRDDAFAEAMSRLADAYPDDHNAAAFYALALLGTSHEGRDFATYMKAAAVVEEVFDANPRHPGAAHYLIHSYDDPIHAPLGLRAARAYSGIAPAAAHALHMPSHIFVALGMWDDVVALNEASWEAAEARIARKNLGSDQRGYHALWWLAYGYLQQGRYEKARAMLAIVAEDARTADSGRVRYHLGMMRAAYLIDTEQWDSDAADLPLDHDEVGLETAANDLLATGLAALRRGDRAAAEVALAALEARRASSDGSSDNPTAAVVAAELTALLAFDAGNTEQALQSIHEAAEAEDAMRFDFGPPSPVKPAHELYGEMLLALDRPAEAQQQFHRALDRTPGRARALLGLARAAARSGDEAEAHHAYETLRQIWHHADPGLPALQEVYGALGAAGSGSE